jgi:Nicotianamine synthase protein
MPLTNPLPQEARERALALCLRVTSEPTPSPAEQERLFAELDELLFGVDEKFTRWILEHPRYRPIRGYLHEIRAQYEYDRERALARRLVAAGDESPLAGFRSASWYEEAHQFELDALAPYAPKRLLVVGAGPFPTTALSFMRAHRDATVACVELRAEAYTLATQVARISNCEALQVIHADALTLEDFSAYDCVIVGTVVGVSEAEKRRVIEHFLEFVPASTLLVLRTAIGPGRIVYPSVDLSQLAGIEYRLLTDPPQETFTMIITDRRELEH